jgi:uncharacterized protein YqeY
MKIEDFKKAKIMAMKEHNKNAISALEVVINKLMNVIIEKRANGEEITEAETLVVLQKVEKELLEEKAGYEKAGRTENIASMDEQIATIKQYLPKMLTEDEIKEIILSLPDHSVPTVMRHFKNEYQGKCDMKIVSSILKSL